MNSRVGAVTYFFSLEVFTGFLFLFLFFIRQQELPPVFSLFGLCVVGIVLFTILLTKFHDRGKWIFLLTFTPVLILVGHLTGLSLYLEFVVLVFVFWRGFVLVNEPSKSFSFDSSLLLSFLIGFVTIIYSAISHYPYQLYIIYLMVFQTLFMVTGSFIRKWLSIPKDKAKFAFYYLRVIAMLISAGAVVTILLKYVKDVLVYISAFFVMILSYLSGPLFHFFQYLVSLFGGEEIKPPSAAQWRMKGKGAYEESGGDPSNLLFYCLIFCIVVGLIFCVRMIRRMRISRLSTNPSAEFHLAAGESALSSGLSLFHKKEKRPNDLIRREIFDFEKYAQKMAAGRYPFETVEEWWRRAGLNGADQAIHIYEKVRYGNQDYSHEELNQLKHELHKLKLQLKER